MKHRLILCRECGQKNQVPLQAWRADCGRCESRLSIPGSTEKMLREHAPTLISAAIVVVAIGLLASGIAEMWGGPETAEAVESTGGQTLADIPG